jgi:hypothetical protein
MASVFHPGKLRSSLAQPMQAFTSVAVQQISGICAPAMRFGPG